MKCSAERLIEALVGIEMARERKAAEDKAAAARRATYVVTVSRGYGSGGAEVAHMLADRLGVSCCDRTILEEVARRAEVDVELVKQLDENIRRIKVEPWKTFFPGKSFPRERYLHHLVKVILNISKKGGVIVGRGAHLILGPAHAFRVRIIGSLKPCAARIAEREHIDLETAQRRVVEINRERADYLEKLYGVSIDDCSDYDLVINSDRFDVPRMTDMILHGMQKSGYDIPADILRSA